MADLVRRLVEHGVPVVLGTARPAPQRHMAHAPAPLGCFPGRPQMHGSHEIFCGIPGASECPYGQRWGLLAKSGTGIR